MDILVCIGVESDAERSASLLSLSSLRSRGGLDDLKDPTAAARVPNSVSKKNLSSVALSGTKVHTLPGHSGYPLIFVRTTSPTLKSAAVGAAGLDAFLGGMAGYGPLRDWVSPDEISVQATRHADGCSVA